MATPYRADHVGSLLRPPELLQARAAHAQGRMTLARSRTRGLRIIPHSTQFSGKGYYRSAKPSGGEDLEVEHPGARR